MKKYTEDRLTKLIRERIKSEYRKYKSIHGIDWQLISAIKIIRTLKEEGFLIDIDKKIDLTANDW